MNSGRSGVASYVALTLWPTRKHWPNQPLVAGSGVCGSRLIPFVLGCGRRWFWLQVVLSVANYVTVIAFLALLGWFVDGSSVSLIGLAGLVLGKFVVGLLRDLAQLALERRIFSGIHWQLSRLSPRLSGVQIASILARDIHLIVEFGGAAHRMIALPICLVVSLVLVLWTYGVAQLALFVGVFAFVPLAFGIASLSASILSKVMTTSKQRIELVATWVNFASLLLNWRALGPIGGIARLLAKESQLRDADSFVRSLDGYMALFGRVFPVLLVTWFAFFSGREEIVDLTLFWLLGPVIAATLELGRLCGEFRQGEASYIHLKKSVEETREQNSERPTLPIVVHDGWDLWEGTVGDNLLGLSSCCQPLLERLGLHEELGGSVCNALDWPIQALGTNISAGQRTRLLVCRAVALARHEERSLDFQLSLSSLDERNKERVELLLAEQGSLALPNAEDTPASHPLLGEPIVQGISVSPALPETPLRSSLGSMFTWWVGLGGLFLVPAAILGFMGSLVGEQQLAQNGGLFFPLALMVAGVVLAASIGWGIETKVRHWTRERAADLLHDCPYFERADVLQRLSRDVTTVMERVAWYAHDIAWIAALGAVTLISFVALNGLVAALLVWLVPAVMLGLWRLLVPAVVEARQRSVESENRVLAIGPDLTSSGHLLTDYADALRFRSALVARGLRPAMNARAAMMATKAGLTRWVELIAGTSVVLAAASMVLGFASSGEAAFVLTTFLAAAGSTVPLFLALAGLKAQRVSVHRLTEKPVVDDATRLLWTTHEHVRLKPPFNDRLGRGYREFEVRRGVVTSLVADSGQGKSQLLKTLARFHSPTPHEAGVFYVDQDWKSVSGFAFGSGEVTGISALLDRLPNPALVCLDEALATYSIAEARVELGEIARWAARKRVAVLFVDHRLAAELTLHVCEVQLELQEGVFQPS